MQSLFIRLVAFGAACWLCVYPVMFVLAGIILLVGTGQGIELLDWTVHEAQRASHRYWRDVPRDGAAGDAGEGDPLFDRQQIYVRGVRKIRVRARKPKPGSEP